jgi:crotonobetainyl-CoA:carnitine CoA-transferase CaiB-like acyl-CoA transferase
LQVSRPLDGISVVDLTNAVGGASAMRLLAGLGAQVLKVESPEGGDFMRAFMPTMFGVLNRDKRSVAIDVRRPDGAALVRRLIARSDVVVESMRPGGAERLGFGRDQLVAENPRLIYASLSGYGSTGPDRSKRSIDAVIQAESGLGVLQGDVLAHTAAVDLGAGLALAHAIVASVLLRERTGEIAHVEVSLLDTALYVQTGALSDYSVTGVQPDEHFTTPRPQVGTYATADRPLFIGAFWEKDWPAICHVLGREDLISTPEYSTAALRRQNRVALGETLAAELRKRPRREWLELFEQHGVIAGELRDYREVFEDPQVSAAASLETFPVGEGSATTVTAPRPPYRLVGGGDAPEPRPAPTLGADTGAALGTLGLRPEEIDALVANGVLGGRTVAVATGDLGEGEGLR